MATSLQGASLGFLDYPLRKLSAWKNSIWDQGLDPFGNSACFNPFNSPLLRLQTFKPPAILLLLFCVTLCYCALFIFILCCSCFVLFLSWAGPGSSARLAGNMRIIEKIFQIWVSQKTTCLRSARQMFWIAVQKLAAVEGVRPGKHWSRVYIGAECEDSLRFLQRILIISQVLDEGMMPRSISAVPLRQIATWSVREVGAKLSSSYQLYTWTLQLWVASLTAQAAQAKI